MYFISQLYIDDTNIIIKIHKRFIDILLGYYFFVWSLYFTFPKAEVGKMISVWLKHHLFFRKHVPVSSVRNTIYNRAFLLATSRRRSCFQQLQQVPRHCCRCWHHWCRCCNHSCRCRTTAECADTTATGAATTAAGADTTAACAATTAAGGATTAAGKRILPIDQALVRCTVAAIPSILVSCSWRRLIFTRLSWLMHCCCVSYTAVVARAPLSWLVHRCRGSCTAVMARAPLSWLVHPLLS